MNPWIGLGLVVFGFVNLIVGARGLRENAERERKRREYERYEQEQDRNIKRASARASAIWGPSKKDHALNP